MELTTSKQPILYVPIGPSGSGKSTLFFRLKESDPNILQFSYDILRHEWYDKNDYKKAWKASDEDPTFYSRANQSFIAMVKSGKDIYVDNTNLSPKSRRFFIDNAKKNGYTTIAYTFNVDTQTLLDRQNTRTDKKVPHNAVKQQVSALKTPTPDEFDEVRSAQTI